LSDAITSSAIGWVVAALAMFGGLATMFWYEFVRVWKTGSTKFL